MPQRNGKFLCSSRDPIKEAKSWLHAYAQELALAETVVVIGCGAGFHLTELLNQYPKMVIEVLELEENLYDTWREGEARFQNHQQIGLVSRETASRQQLVLDFKPAWVGFEETYKEISSFLKEAELGDIKKICSGLAMDDQSTEAKIWRSLREMVV